MNIVMTKLNDIRPYPNNPRKNDRAVETVKRSIEQYGFQQPIVVDRDGVIIVGHTRYRAAQSLGLKEIPVLHAVELTDEQTRAYRLMDNRSNENAQWDQTKLVEELGEMLKSITLQDASEQSGFTESELNRLFKDESEIIQALQTTPLTTYSRTGDIWTLGNHRIINGDSTDANVVAQVLQGDRIDLVWEDAPYGVAYQTVNGIQHSDEYNQAKNHKIANDTLQGEELDQFLNAHITAVLPHVRPGSAIYWCHDIRYNHQFKQVLETNNIHIADTLIWKKNAHSTWLCDYAKMYEPILYGWKEGAEHRWYGYNMERNTIEMDTLDSLSKEQLIDIIREWPTNYQEFKRETRAISNLHPTVKPVRLIAYHIIHSTQPNDIVYDGFSGSGSTLMACETQSRRARCVELEPKFVDVTIRRWQEHTGLQAVRQDGVLWDDLVQQGQALDIDQQLHDNMVELFNLPEN